MGAVIAGGRGDVRLGIGLPPDSSSRPSGRAKEFEDKLALSNSNFVGGERLGYEPPEDVGAKINQGTGTRWIGPIRSVRL